ncbi:hypothetical protein CR513_31045, partial [Mucuna pruriens]
MKHKQLLKRRRRYDGIRKSSGILDKKVINMVLVKKSNEWWRMNTNYTNLNKACLKDAYPLPSID